MKLFRFIAALTVISATAWIAIAIFWKPQSAETTNRIKIVAAENFWGDIARQIGGSKVNVTSIISDPATDPHLYESSAQNAAAVAGADLVVVNGLGYDDFMDKMLAASRSPQRQVVKAADVQNSRDDNPHIWYSMPRVQLVAAQIEAKLESIDPSGADEYRSNLDNFNAEILKVSEATAKIAANHAGAPVAYSERVPEYLLVKAGLNVVVPGGFAKAIEEGNDPTPADTAALQALIASRGIKVFLYNSQASSPAAQQIREMADRAGIPVVGVTETMPADQPDFQTWQLSQIKALEAALDAK